MDPNISGREIFLMLMVDMVNYHCVDVLVLKLYIFDGGFLVLTMAWYSEGRQADKCM